MPSRSTTDAAPEVFRYLDHRAYLADFFAHKQQRGLTYRGFSRRAGLGAPNYLKQVIDGQKRLGPTAAPSFARACGLSGDAFAYFCTLVAFNHARKLEDKNRALATLESFRSYRSAHPLAAAEAEYHAHAYLPAIRELVSSPHFREDPAWIAKTLRPAIKAAEAKRALAMLEAMGLLVRNAEGRLVQAHAVVSTGPEAKGVHVANYHAEMMRRATESMELVPAAERDLSAVTMCVARDALPELKRRILAFRRELIAFAEASSDKTHVYQLNVQLFPLSHDASSTAHLSSAKTAARKR